MNMGDQPYRRRPFPGFLMIIAAVFAVSWIVMLLWNAILPALVHVNPITYWQSMGLLALCRILFGGFKFGPPNGRRAFGPNRWREKWMNMSEEQRAKFKEEWKEKCRRR
ncbi:MAG: hypothetical protein QM802_16185 [Agriterribacter sp.]